MDYDVGQTPKECTSKMLDIDWRTSTATEWEQVYTQLTSSKHSCLIYSFKLLLKRSWNESTMFQQHWLLLNKNFFFNQRVDTSFKIFLNQWISEMTIQPQRRNTHSLNCTIIQYSTFRCSQPWKSISEKAAGIVDYVNHSWMVSFLWVWFYFNKVFT